MKSMLVISGDNFSPVTIRKTWKVFSAPKPFIPALSPSKTIRSALLQPEGVPPLMEILLKSKRVVIAFDDITVPFPPMINDIRKTAIGEVLKLIGDAPIPRENVTLLCATGLRRRCLPSEVKQLLGRKILTKWIDRIKFHREKDSKWIGDTEKGERVEINKLLLEADTVIYISILFLPLSGGWTSIITGTGSFNSIIEVLSPDNTKKGSYFDPGSRFFTVTKRMGKIIKKKVNIFKIELVLSNLFLPPVELGGKILSKISVPFEAFNYLPNIVKNTALHKIKAWYPLYKVFAGDPDIVNQEALNELINQLQVNGGNKKFDIIMFGVPDLSPFSINTFNNPVLVHTMVNGYLYNLFGKALKKNGFIIFWNPLEEKFDFEQHYPHAYFYNNHLPLDCERNKELEEFYWKNRDFHHLYYNGFGFHGGHGIVAWYLGCRGKMNTEGQIAVGANPYVAEKLGISSANNINDALEEAAKKVNPENAALFLFPPVFLIR